MSHGAETREKGHGAEGMRLVRPRALLLTAAPPQQDGTPRRREAWQLLDLVRQTHEVHLIARSDSPVHYDHWRRLAQLTRRIALAPGSRLLFAQRTVAGMVDAWATDTSFDAVLCSDDSLWRPIASIPARVRFCQSRHDLGLLADVLSPPTFAETQWTTAAAARRAA